MQKVLNLAKKAYDGLLDNFYFFVFVFLLNYLTVSIYILFFEPSAFRLLKALLAAVNIFFISYLVIAPVIFFPAISKNIYKAVCLGVLSLLCCVEGLILYYFHSLYSPSLMLILFQTNRQESCEFLSLYLNVVNVCMLIFCILLLAGFIKMSYKKVMPVVRKKKLKFVLFVLFFCLLIGGAGITSYSQYRASKMLISFRLISPLQRLFYSSYISYTDMRAYQQLATKVKQFDFDVSGDSASIPNVVLIMGESLGRNHMSLYGYPLPTTPFLNKLYREGKLMRFNDVVTSGTTTIESLESIFTFYSREKAGEWLDYPIWIGLMKKAGYRTNWVSNQENSGVWGNLPFVIAQRSDEVLFNKIRNSKEENYGIFDGQLLPLVKEKLNYTNVNNFIVIHLMGSHTRYSNRYPENFTFFRATDYPDKIHPEAIAEYDNSVLYNDYVINELIHFFEDKKAIIFYLSDHGEEVYDYRDFAGHSLTNVSRYMVEVPFVIWMSDSFRAEYPEKKDALIAAQNCPYMTDDLIHTLLDIMGIKTSLYEKERSVINKSFNKYRLRNVNGNINYDLELKGRN